MLFSGNDTIQWLDVLKTFQNITERIVSYEEGLDTLVQDIVRLTVSILDVSYASILLLDENHRQYHSLATHGEFPFPLDFKVVSDISKIKGCPVSSATRMAFIEFVDTSEWNNLDPEYQETLGKVLCSPLVANQESIGLACAYRDNVPFSVLESEAFCLLSDLTALAVEKSRLYSRVQRNLEKTRQELKRAQSQLIRSEKLDSLFEIAMSVNHSIRNPVTVIGGLSQRMLKSFPENDERRVWAKMIMSEASRLESIVNDFKRFSALKNISFEKTDINMLVSRVTKDFLEKYPAEKKIRLHTHLFSEPIFCRIDPGLIRRCLLHLLANGVEAAVDGISIKVTTKIRDGMAVIDVIDSGRGLARQERDHIFDPFYTTKGEGAGIGLTFVHFAISENSGEIDIAGEEGIGTRFRIRLPLIS